jgi:hypothetical protein
MNITKQVLSFTVLACLVTTFSGCSTPSETLPASAAQTALPPPPETPPPQPKTRSGLALSDAQDRAVKLEIGMAQNQVQQILGSPDETSARTYGSNTAQPWAGVEWEYRWHLGAYENKRLDIVFAHGRDSWIVNNWNWFDF